MVVHCVHCVVNRGGYRFFFFFFFFLVKLMVVKCEAVHVGDKTEYKIDWQV